MVSHVSNHVFSIPRWLIFSWFSTLLCREAGIIILLPSIAIPSMTTSSLKDQYGCTSFITSALVDGHPCITWINSAPIWSSYRVACLISSPVIHFGMSVHVSMACMFMFSLIPSIPSSQFSHGLCLDSQSAINISGPVLCILPVLYFLKSATSGL